MHASFGRLVPPVGGLKLTLRPALPQNRRARFARVALSRADGTDGITLVTDADGRLRYRLASGEYLLSVVGDPQVVRDQRWTIVRLRLG